MPKEPKHCMFCAHHDFNSMWSCKLYSCECTSDKKSRPSFDLNPILKDSYNKWVAEQEGVL